MPWKNQSEEKERYALAREMMRGKQTVAALSRKFGVSRETAYKWRARFEAQGRSGLVSRQRGRPKTQSAGRTKWLQRVLGARRHRPTWGAPKLRWWLRRKHPKAVLPSVRTIQRWLLAAGRVQPRRRRLRAGAGLSHVIVARASNDVWTIDFKGTFTTRDGRKVLPFTVRDAKSRFILSVQPVRATSEGQVRRVMARLFRRYGAPRAIRTDRGSPFCGSGPYGLTAVSLWWTRLGIEVQFVSRRRGLDNNAHEQMHRILKAEIAHPPARTYAAQQRRLQRWRHHYNHHRPHAALGDRTPAALYRPSPRLLPPLLPPRYAPAWTTRRVRPHGYVKLHGTNHHIGRAFVNLVVGFALLDNLYHVYFDRLLLGTLDPLLPRSGLVPVSSSK
jgi:transposase InsO family protein